MDVYGVLVNGVPQTSIDINSVTSRTYLVALSRRRCWTSIRRQRYDPPEYGTDAINGAASITTDGSAVNLTLAEADALLNGNGNAETQTGTIASDITVTGRLGHRCGGPGRFRYELRHFDTPTAIAQALNALDESSVNGAQSIATDGTSVSLVYAEADALLNGNGIAATQTGTDLGDITVTGTVTVADASNISGTIYTVQGPRGPSCPRWQPVIEVSGADSIIVDGVINYLEHQALVGLGVRCHGPGSRPVRRYRRRPLGHRGPDGPDRQRR